jgi:tetratricopeptide (TPR) repeat protein
MDAPLIAAARALSQGDPLGALKHVALRADAHALALRATAMAQLGEYKSAKDLFRRATKSFSQDHATARARCVVAQAEVALASRELTLGDAGLARAIDVLQRNNDGANARYAQLIRARHALAMGDVKAARERLDAIDARTLSPALRALRGLAQAEVAWRLTQPAAARAALTAAHEAARRSQIPALLAEVVAAQDSLSKPVARLVAANTSSLLTLDQVAALGSSARLVVDACRRVIRQGPECVELGTRPVLFNLARRLAEATPEDVSREELIRVGFGIQRANDSLRVRLRVAMTRLRRLLAKTAKLEATARGFILVPHTPPALVLLPPVDDEASSLLALLSDGEAWSTSALALALGKSQRSVQRALGALENADKVRTLGRGKNQRWLPAPLTQFATPLLLPMASPPA